MISTISIIDVSSSILSVFILTLTAILVSPITCIYKLVMNETLIETDET